MQQQVHGERIDATPLSTSDSWSTFVQAARGSKVQANTLRIVEAAGLRVDVSAQPYSLDLLSAGVALLHDRGFEAARARLLQGGIANETENRPAWHTALRAEMPPAAVASDVLRERQRLREFVDRLDKQGFYRNVLHIGIGGSDWGPKLAVSALGYAGTRREIRFVANIDGHAMINGVLGLDPRTTLVVVSSKSFSTVETMRNADKAIAWLKAGGVEEPMSQVVAVTANVDAARGLGIADERIFEFWDWAGGRYSVWSSIGLPIALALGNQALDAFRAGAAAMDQHFAQAPLESNAPVQLALAGVVNRSVQGFQGLGIAPYDARLSCLVPYLQQLDMESLGKSVDVSGNPVTEPTGPIVWGMPGTDGQHTFFQWLHQGPEGAPVDFIVCRDEDHTYPEHHRLLVANCLAQREALLRGNSVEDILPSLLAAGMPPEQARWLARHKASPGGRPSNLIVLPRLDAHALGALLALYEHKVFTQAVIWGIDPFDQWGVEYGKVLATGLLRELEGGDRSTHDVSTTYWVDQWLGGGRVSGRRAGDAAPASAPASAGSAPTLG